MQFQKDNGRNEQERAFVAKLGNDVFTKLAKEFEEYLGLELSPKYSSLIKQEIQLAEQNFFAATDRAYLLAKDSYEHGSYNAARMRFANSKMDAKLNRLSEKWPQSSGAWIIGGLLFSSQIAGLKNIYGIDADKASVIDVLGSATSLSLGAQNPYLMGFDRIEDAVGLRDNISTVYHMSLKQAFFFEEAAKLYPATLNKELSIYSESSASNVNSMAMESALAFIEKREGCSKSRILAIDGTWAGGHGIAREATGFGVNNFELNRSKKSLFVDRCLPSPSKEEGQRFLEILQEKVEAGDAAGLILEPDIVGDAGIISVDPDVLKKAVDILGKAQLPIIADCVQQIGRSGNSYWGENVETVLRDYPWLILTTAKSASNGQPFSYAILPKEIADSAYPVSHVTTNQCNGPLLRAVGVSRFMQDSELQNWLSEKGAKIAEIAQHYDIPLGHAGLRGKYMNRAVYVGDNEMVKLAQIALLVEDGILTGALPQSLRYQPMLLDYSSTNEAVAHIIFRRVNEVMKGNVSQEVQDLYARLEGEASGLAR